mgnify:CR=1 FL=1
MKVTDALHQSLREAALLFIASALLGFSYTFLMNKGIFSTPVNQNPVVTRVVPPEFISFDEALGLSKSGAALFVDTRHDFDYKLGHIRGAINVPLKDFDLSTSALAAAAKDRVIITYCDGAECNSSIELAKKLSEAGFTNVKMFFGGWTEWRQRQLQTEQ